MKEKPTVSVIIVNYNGGEHIASCIEALCTDQQYPSTEILFVDNASTDCSLEVAKEVAAGHPEIKIIKSAVNRGFSAGINLGFSHAKGKYIAVLNMDTMVEEGWLLNPIEFMESNPQVGAISPLLVLDADKTRINAIGQDIHVTGLGFNRDLWKNRFHLIHEPIKVSGIHGAAFITRKNILDQIGGMDEVGFLYHEDVELSWLLQLMGYKLYCIPTSVVSHKYFLSMHPEKLYLLERNRLTMLLCNLDVLTLLLLIPILLLTELLMWGYCILRGRNFLAAKLASYKWILQQAKYIKDRRNWVRSLRKCNDWQILRGLTFSFAWRQFLNLGLENENSRRQPTDGIPVKIG